MYIIFYNNDFQAFKKKRSIYRFSKKRMFMEKIRNKKK